MNGYQQGGLPADPYQQQWQPIFVDFNNPPPLPNYQCSQNVAQWLAPIAVLAVQAIQDNLGKNPLRLFTFNLYARNGYNNQEFHKLVMALGDWLDLCMAQGQYPDPQTCVTNIVPMMVEMVTCVQLRIYPQLMQCVDQNLANAAAMHVQRFDNLSGEIQRFQNGMQMQQQRRQMTQQSSGWAQAQMGTNVGAQAWGNDNSWMGGAPAQPRNVQSHMGGGATALFSGQQQPNRYDQADNSAPSRYDRPRRQQSQSYVADVGEVSQNQNTSGVETVRSQDTYRRRPYAQPDMQGTRDVAQATPAPAPAPHQPEPQKHAELLADESGLKWTPSLRQPYPLTYNPRTHLLYHRQLPTGEIVEVTKPREENSMDYEKHRLPTSFGPAPRTFDAVAARKKQEALQSMLADPVSLDDPDLTDEQRELLKDRVVREDWLLEPALSTSWIVGLIGRYAAKTEAEPAPYVFHRRAKVVQAIVADTDQTELVRQLSTEETYAGLRLKLLAMGERMTPDLWRLCERKITRAVNRVLNQRLSMKISIDSFVEDITDLMDTLRDKHGEMMINAFLDDQDATISNTFEVLTDEFDEYRDLMTENFLAEYSLDKDTTSLHFTYVASSVSLTLVNCLSHELEIELNSKVAALVTTMTPFVRALCEDILDNVCSDDAFDRHLIRTADGVILELTTGLIGNKSMLLKIVEQ